jgi:hypothetical protein
MLYSLCDNFRLASRFRSSAFCTSAGSGGTWTKMVLVSREGEGYHARRQAHHSTCDGTEPSSTQQVASGK